MQSLTQNEEINRKCILIFSSLFDLYGKIPFDEGERERIGLKTASLSYNIIDDYFINL